MSNVTELPSQPDMAGQMKGPKSVHHAVIVDGRVIPNLGMVEHGQEVEFILDGRFSYSFPREFALLAAAFAAQSQAIGAGYPHLNAASRERPFAPQAMQMSPNEN